MNVVPPVAWVALASIPCFAVTLIIAIIRDRRDR